jgi:hypothetical protein
MLVRYSWPSSLCTPCAKLASISIRAVVNGLDEFVRDLLHLQRYFNANQLSSLEVHHCLVLDQLFNWHVRGRSNGSVPGRKVDEGGALRCRKRAGARVVNRNFCQQRTRCGRERRQGRPPRFRDVARSPTGQHQRLEHHKLRHALGSRSASQTHAARVRRVEVDKANVRLPLADKDRVVVDDPHAVELIVSMKDDPVLAATPLQRLGSCSSVWFLISNPVRKIGKFAIALSLIDLPSIKFFR